MGTTTEPPLGAFGLDEGSGSDPFVTGAQDAHRQRYSAFDNSQFSLYLDGSPDQAKRALQAHLSETTRRLQETSQLGNALVQQRKELEEKLSEVEKQQKDNEIGPELRQRLAELEKEFNEVGRETARAFLPKSRVPSGEPDTTGGASVYSSEALHSPSKVSVPSRKQRNQQPSRVNDIALATEISTSLLSQLRELQAVLQEKDEALRATNLDRSQLEVEVEGLSQRLRTLDESESRLKDVNWNLETQVREFEAQNKSSTDKEHRLNQSLNLARSEKASLEREVEELKQIYSKLQNEHVTSAKQHETELSGLRRNVAMGETERGALHRKVEELATQNQELARAVAYRLRTEDQSTADEASADDGAEEGDTITPEQSPPPSPSKATPRHGQLESETLKHSLHHAHRMIQQLKNNIHREKTEKIELKRMLQDARDELETNRSSLNGPGSASKRRKNDKDVFKKPARPDRLGALRNGSQEIVLDDDEWEEQDGVHSTPSRRSRHIDNVPGAFPSGFSSAAENSTDAFETANETSDAFETANERDGTTTETDAFQTGAETLDGDSSDDLTETEAGPTDTVRAQRPTALAVAGNRNSYHSTASTSGDDDDNLEIRTPVQSQHPRYRLKLRHSGYRRSTPRSSQELFSNTPPAAKDSPASYNGDSRNSTPAQGKSLFAELGALSGESEDGSVADSTPSRSILLSPESSPEALRKSAIGRSPLQSLAIQRPEMMDSGMMTEPWPTTVPVNMSMSSHTTQHTQPLMPKLEPLGLSTLSSRDTAPQHPSKPLLQLSTLMAQDTLPKPMTQHPLHMSPLHAQETTPIISHQDMRISQLIAQDTAPILPTSPSLLFSSVSSQATAPLSPTVDKTIPPSLNISTIAQQATEPTEENIPKSLPPAALLMSSISTQATEPSDSPASGSRDVGSLHESLPSVASYGRERPLQESLNMSQVFSQGTAPVEAPRPIFSLLPALSSTATEPIEPPKPAALQLSTLSSQMTQPVELPKAAAFQLSSLSSQMTQPVEAAKQPLPQLSRVSSQHTESVQPPQVPLRISAHSAQSTAPVNPPRRALPEISTLSVQHTPPVEPSVSIRPQHRVSDVTVIQDTQPESPTLPAFLPSPSRPSTATRVTQVDLSFSEVFSQDTEPQNSSRPVTAHRAVPPATSTSANPEMSVKQDASKLDYFGSVLPWSKDTPTAFLESSNGADRSRDGREPLAPISSNSVQKPRSQSPAKPPRIPVADEGTQTMVSAEQMDRLFALRSNQRHSGNITAAAVEKRLSPPASPRRNSLDPQKTPRRPGSSGSMRSRAASPPPLPADHKEVIAAASLKTPSLNGSAPTTPGIMGPPTMPASAYKKRPQTPTIKTNNVASSPKTGGTTPRARHNSQRGDIGRSGASSPVMTHRSSVSSFTSEVDSRFQTQANPLAQSGFDPQTTDPRMIQAITQTMIGEYLWKYTRKAGSGNMSEKRHRRFFWVHPYTRTLYWSEQDPATAGRAQSKAKSVAILAVEVVTDDNPYPPGLHRKSLVIHTPGRSVQFTATTSQRHETWFNALSYLLMRVGEQPGEQQVGGDEIQNEFNPAYRSSSRQTGRSKASMSSHFTRRTSSPHHAQIPTLRPSSAAQQRASSVEPGQERPSGRLSSLSGMFRDSFSSRRSRTGGIGTYDQPEHDSRLEVAEHLAEQSMQDDQLINVRACCDGKHDVGHLHGHSLRARHSHNGTRASLTASLSSRSHSRASGRHGQNGQLQHQNELESTKSSAGH